MGRLGFWGFCIFLVCLGHSAMAESVESPVAPYRSGDQLIYTLPQFEDLVKGQLPDMKPIFTKLAEPVEYRGQLVAALQLNLEGLNDSTQVYQTLTYVQTTPGLWQLAFVKGRHCVRGEAIRDGVWVKDWFCDSKGMEQPISRHVAHLYIIESETVDLALIAKTLGREIQANTPENTTSQAPPTPSLGDLRQWIENQGFQWQQAAEMYVPATRPEESPRQAVRITVSGRPLVGHHFEQSFLYVVDEQELQLREIKGLFCQYIERMQKDICDDEPGYYPSSYTPFPMRLVNTDQVLGHFKREKSTVLASSGQANLNCALTASIYQDINRFHLERGLLSAFDTHHVQEALNGLVDAIDPNLFFFQGEDRNKVTAEVFAVTQGQPEVLKNLIAQLQAADQGGCDRFQVVGATLHRHLLDQGPALAAVIKASQDSGFQPQAITERLAQESREAQMLWQKIQTLPLPLHLPEGVGSQVRLAEVQKYFKESLELTQDPEWLALASFARLDVYSQMLRPSMSRGLQETLSGTAQRLYFGLSVVDGFGRYWLNSLHPKIKSSQVLQTGDEVIEINGLKTAELTPEQVDDELLKTEQNLNLKLKRDQAIFTVSIQASRLNPIDLSYELTNWSEEPKAPLLLSLRSFESGLNEALRPRLLKALESNSNGLVIDLRGNPGGNVEEARRVLSYFIQDRPLGYYRMGSRLSGQLQTLQPEVDDFVSDTLPLVVLVDRTTMSASEIFVSALKDLGRAVIIGETTHGKLVGQNLFALGETRRKTPLNLLITTTEYFSPSGLSLNQKGVQPDVEWTLGDLPPRQDLVDGLGPGQDLMDLVRPGTYQTSMLEFDLF